MKKITFRHCVKAIVGHLCEEEGWKVTRTQLLAIEALQWAAEAFFSDLFSASVDEIVYAARKTLNVVELLIKVKMKFYKYDLLEDWEPFEHEK